MPQFIIANMARGKHSFEVHSVKCGDLKRKHARDPISINGTFRVEAESGAAAVANEVAAMAAQDQHWPVEEFKVFPCCKTMSEKGTR